MESFVRGLQGFGFGRLAAVLGASAGVAAVLVAVMLKMGGQPTALLYSNLDLKEASQITSALDQAGVKYEAKGDGSTIMVDRDHVAATRLLLSGKGLPTSGSVGYEIFDNAPALGQTDFVQNLNRQRALEGELARTINSIQGVSSARVHLVLPKRQLFEEEQEAPSASIMIAIGGRSLSADQVRAVRNLVAGAVPNLKPDRVTLVDQQGELLAGAGEDAAGDAVASAKRTEVEERIRKTVKDIVEGVVGAGKARVQVTADVDLTRVTTQEEKFDPDGQVVRSTQTNAENASENKPGPNGAVSAAQNIPNAAASSGTSQAASNSGRNEETTNYEISKTTRTEIQEPGTVKKLSVAVAVDGVSTPGPKGKPPTYAPRTAEEMKRIDQLVRSAVGFDESRHDQVSVVNVRFERPDTLEEGVSAASPFAFDKNDIMRVVELVVLLAVAVMLMLFVVRPLFKAGGGGGGMPALAMAGAGGGPGGATALLPAPGAPGGQAGQQQIAYDPQTGQPLLAAPGGGELEGRLDIARIEGQVKASSVKQVAEFVEKHPDESVSILRSWLHEA